MIDTIEALLDEHDTVWGSMVKQTLKRKMPQFNESAHGYRSFNALLQEAEKRGMLRMEKDSRSGGYRITGLGPESQ